MNDAIYEQDGNVYVPTDWARGPWMPGHQHGGAVNALFARATEEAATRAGLQVVRITIELFRPVPTEPLVLAWRFVREGKRIAVVEAWLTRPGEDEPMARASATLLRPNAELPRSWTATPPEPVALADAEPIEIFPGSRTDVFHAGFHLSFQARMAHDAHGPMIWLTSELDFLPGVPMTPFERLAALSDATFGMTGRTVFGTDTPSVESLPLPMINVDTTVYLERPPHGEWLGFRPVVVTDRDGVGLAEADLADPRGRVGRCIQSMLVTAMPDRDGA